MAANSRSHPVRRRIVGAALSLVLFVAAMFVLRSELRDHPLHEILAELRRFPPLRLMLSLAATGLGYLALAGYDALSLATLGRRLPFRRVAYAAFLGYAFANSLPLSVVTGAAVRFRLYSQWGIARGDAARVITLNTVTYVAGLLASAGLAFALQPVLVPGFLHLPLRTARPIGFACLAVVAGYLVWSSRPGGDLRLWRWRLPRPTLRRAIAQIGVSIADWVFWVRRCTCCCRTACRSTSSSRCSCWGRSRGWWRRYRLVSACSRLSCCGASPRR